MNRIAHLVFGSEENANEEETNVGQLVETDIDGDWILIEVEDENESDKKHTQLPQVNQEESHIDGGLALASNCVPETEAKIHIIHGGHDNEESSFSPIPMQAIMEESWFVTPPPCFVNNHSEGGVITLETSPLEDLLIEHPSISVFGPSLPRSPSLSSLPSSESSSTSSNHYGVNSVAANNASMIIVPSGRTTRQMQRQIQAQQGVQHARQNNIATRRANNNANLNHANVSPRTVLNEWESVLFSMQKQETAQNQNWMMNKTQMKRCNEVAVVRNGRPNRRAKMALRPNGICNNRKC